MRRNLSLPLALLILLAPAAARQTQEWQKFAPEGEGFSVLLPTPPTAETKTNPANPRMKMRLYTSETGDYYFNVSSFDFSEVAAPPTPANFDAFVAGFEKSYCQPSLKLGYLCAITFGRGLSQNGYAGKLFKVSITANGQTTDGVLRIIMTPKRIFAFQALGGKEGDATIDKFMASFTIAAARPATR